MSWTRAGFGACLVLLGACSTPMLEITGRDPAAVLQPLSRSNIVDGRAGFRQLFCAINRDHGSSLPDYRHCDDSLHKLADEPALAPAPDKLAFRQPLTVYFIAGIFAECIADQIPLFSYAIEHLRSHGIAASVVPGIRGRASSAHNAGIIHEFFSGVEKADEEKLLVVAYSKGTTDMLWYLSDENHASSYSKIDALISVAGVVNGTPLADDTNMLMRKLAEMLPLSDCPTQDGSGIDDLTREQQFLRLASHPTPSHIRYYSLVAYANLANTSDILKDSYRRLAMIDPRNDGQVIYYDSVLPRAHLLGYANADHWAVALPYRRHKVTGLIAGTGARGASKNAYPREVLVEAIVLYVDRDLAGKPAEQSR